jgi:hypothetical protein
VGECADAIDRRLLGSDLVRWTVVNPSSLGPRCALADP